MNHIILGKFDKKRVRHLEKYFIERYTFLDCRGDLFVSELSHWGFGVKVVTLTHDISSGEFNMSVRPREVRVDEHAWIGSFAMLYNCHIKHHAIVALGSVVRGMTVEPYTIVGGNPARVISRWDNIKEKWQHEENVLKWQHVGDLHIGNFDG